jgi:antitoxin (DNA-binding transcriptional repressor) of toxin-antitoxin stability system
MTVFNMHQAKTELSRLVAMAEAGEEVVIARHNIAVAKIVPVGSALGRGKEPGEAPASTGFGEEAQMGFSAMDEMIGNIAGPAAQAALNPRKPGALKGMFSLPDSFFDPLPEEELQAWEGEFSFDPDRKP